MERSFNNSQVDDAIDAAVDEGRIVGTRVLVSVDGETVHARSAGHADRESGRPLTDDAIFLLASISKPFVTATAMSLVETGELALDAPVTRYLPDFRPRTADGAEPAITIEQLLTHTSGLSYGMDPESFDAFHEAGASNGLDQPGLDAREAARRLAQVPLSRAPGEAWDYSTGIDVVGWAIEAVTGQQLGDVVAERVTVPLGIVETGYTVADRSRLLPAWYANTPDGVERMTDDYTEHFNGFRTTFAPARVLDPASYHSGGAGLVGTAEDVVTFLEEVRTGAGAILRPDTLAAMKRVHAGQDTTASGPGIGFGLGWAVLTDPVAAGSPQSPGTLSWGGAYGHTWFVDPERRLTVVALTNTGPEGLFGAFPVEVRDAVYDAL